MMKNSRSPWWRRAHTEVLRVELLEERKLLDGRGDWAGRDFDADAEWPDDETQSAEVGSASEVDDGENHEVESDDGNVEVEKYEVESDDGFAETEGYEVEWDEEPISEAGERPSYHEVEEDGEQEGADAISRAPSATQDSGAIESFEDELVEVPSSQPIRQESDYSANGLPAATFQVPGGSSSAVNIQSGNTTSNVPPTPTTPTTENQLQAAELGETDAEFDTSESSAQSADESHEVSEARATVARQTGTRIESTVDGQAEAVRFAAAAQNVESTPNEPAANRDSDAQSVSTAAVTAAANLSEQSAPVVHTANEADQSTGQTRKNGAMDSSENVETSTAVVELAANKSLGSDSLPLLPAALPLAAIVDAVLVTPPQVAGLLTDFISIDMASIEREIDTLLGQIDGLRRELVGSLAELNLPTWFLAAAVGAAATEVVRLQRKRLPGALAAVVYRDGSSSTWLPDSAGPAPEELT